MTKEKVVNLSQAALKKLIELYANTETIFVEVTTEMINLRSELEIPKGSSFNDSLKTPTPNIDDYVRKPYGDK